MNPQALAAAPEGAGPKTAGDRKSAFTRMVSPVPREIAQRPVALSKESSVTEEPASSGRETKPPSTAIPPASKPPSPAGAASEVAEERGDEKDEGGIGEAHNRGEGAREGFISSAPTLAVVALGAKA